MTDQCKHCELRGDIEKCLAADCFQHENWYAIKQQERIKELENALNDFVTEFCAREGDEDYPLPIIKQDDPLVRKAMTVLGLDY